MYEEGTLPRLGDHRSFPPAGALQTSVTLHYPHVAIPGPSIPSASSTPPPTTRPVCCLFHGPSGSKNHQEAYGKS